MKRCAKTVLMLSMAVLLASNLSAAEGEKKKRGKKRQGDKGMAVVRFLPPEVKETLNEDQKEKITQIQKQFGPKLTAIQDQKKKILTPDQIQCQTDARKKAQKEGKKGKQVQEAVDQAVEIPEEQKKKLKGIQEQTQLLQKTIQAQVIAILTPEQQEKLPKQILNKLKGKEKGKDGDKPKEPKDGKKPPKKGEPKPPKKDDPKQGQKPPKKDDPKQGQKPPKKDDPKQGQKPPKKDDPKQDQKPPKKDGPKPPKKDKEA
jgi:hypothetical protein